MANWTRHWNGGGNGAWIYRHPDATYPVIESPFGVFYRGKAFASVRDAQQYALGKSKARAALKQAEGRP